METNITSEDDFYQGPLSWQSYTLMACYMVFTGVSAIVGNGLILFVFIKNRLFRKPLINVLIINLLAGNLGESVLGFPLGAASNFARRWLFGPIGCSFYGFVCYLCALSNMCTYVAISLYRYLVVCRPSQVGRFLHVRWMRRAVLAIWLYSLLWATLPLVGWGAYGPEPHMTTCSLKWTSTKVPDRAYIFAVFTFVFALPVSLMIFAYVRIVWGTHNQVGIRNKPKAPESMQLSIDNALHGINYIKDIEARTTKIVFVTVLLYLGAWMPYAVMSMMAAFGLHIPVVASAVPTMMAKGHAFFNPLIYVIAHHKFRVSLFELFGLPTRDAERTVELAPSQPRPSPATPGPSQSKQASPNSSSV